MAHKIPVESGQLWRTSDNCYIYIVRVGPRLVQFKTGTQANTARYPIQFRPKDGFELVLKKAVLVKHGQ